MIDRDFADDDALARHDCPECGARAGTEHQEWCPEEQRAADERVAEVLPFGLDRADQIVEPFCACGHVISRCDRSRRACGGGR